MCLSRLDEIMSSIVPRICLVTSDCIPICPDMTCAYERWEVVCITLLHQLNVALQLYQVINQKPSESCQPYDGHDYTLPTPLNFCQCMTDPDPRRAMKMASSFHEQMSGKYWFHCTTVLNEWMNEWYANMVFSFCNASLMSPSYFIVLKLCDYRIKGNYLIILGSLASSITAACSAHRTHLGLHPTNWCIACSL